MENAYFIALQSQPTDKMERRKKSNKKQQKNRHTVYMKWLSLSFGQFTLNKRTVYNYYYIAHDYHASNQSCFNYSKIGMTF